MTRRHVAFALVFAVCVAYGWWALFVAEYGVPQIDAGASEVWLGEVAGPVTVAQTFRVDADGLSAVTVRPRAAGSPEARADLDVVFAVAEMSGDRTAHLLYRIAQPLRDVVARRHYTVRFPRIDDSAGRQFRVEIGVPLAGSGEGLELLASREPRYHDGAAFLGGREQWSDLEFSATAEGATASRRFEARLASSPAFVRSRWALGALLLLYDVVLGWFLWIAICTGGPEDAKEAEGAEGGRPQRRRGAKTR